MDAPVGYLGIIARFGDPSGVVPGTPSEQRWKKAILQYILLPTTILLPGGIVQSRMGCHRGVADSLTSILNRGEVWSQVRSIGCYNFRRKHSAGIAHWEAPTDLSTHGWGIAVDINSDTNPRGSDGDMSPDLVAAFEDAGWHWGGHWGHPDPMHFQYATGY